MSAMNLALQTRRAVITLSLMALAMACIAAKATRTDARLSAEAPVRVEAVAHQSIEVTGGSVVVRIAEPVTVNVAAKRVARCEGKIVRI
jgi:hypothetical protein